MVPNRKMSVVEDDGEVVLQLHPYKPGQHIERLYLNPIEAMRMYTILGHYLTEKLKDRNDEATRG